jgi:hypothetical protein
MLKSALVAGALLVAFAAPGYAETYTCDEATMTKWKTDIDAMSDVAMKEKHTKSYTSAMEAMKANKMDDCVKFMSDMRAGSNDSQGSSKSTTTN